MCRSFSSMADLASVKTVILYLSEELYDAAALRDVLRALHALNKAEMRHHKTLKRI